MASNEIEVLDPAAAVDKLNKVAAGRALNRRRFLAALGMTGAAAGAGLLSGCTTTKSLPVATLGADQANVLTFALNLEYLEATLYSYLITGADLNPQATGINLARSGAVTGAPGALAVSAALTSQTFDLLSEAYFDEWNHVVFLQNILGSTAIPRPALNLAAFGAIDATNALSVLRLVEDIGVTAYAGAIPGLTTSNATYAAQILGTESFHSGALRLLSIQNPTIAPYIPAADGLDVPPDDLGSATAEAGGPTSSGGFFPTYGASGFQSNAGSVIVRSPSQILALLYGTVTTLAASGTTSGGFFPSGVNGSVNTV